ncbi:DMT family transporter [Chthonobacter albigriseus]|uniref:DMT family transporter n=1 Tax=Chthonobacter albigriseus TaxID=1683161 RepID=UPI0015EEB9D0|nr:DMT family transporter [Chthonobacter albigriseus]
MKIKDVASYVFLALAWGFSFLVILKAVHAFGWVGAVAFRSLVAGVTLVLAAALLRRRMDFGFGLFPLAVVGATTVAGQLLGLSYATPRIGTAMAAILVASIPMLSMLIARLWNIERIPPQGVVGLFLGLAGIVMLVGFPAVAVTPTFVLGCASALFGCLCAAVGSVYASQRLKGAGTWEITAGSFLWGGLFSLPLLAAVPVPGTPQPVDYVYLLILGCVMSATTYVLYFRLVSTIGPTRAISVEFAVTVVAVLVGAFALHEPLSALQVVGAATIVCGCALVLGLLPVRLLARLRPAA